jgi:hexosaminidase
VNLLPVPRTLRLDGPPVAAAAPVVSIDGSLPAEGYRLSIGPSGVSVVAADEAGAFYARATLAQVARLSPDGMLPSGTVEDWPDLPVRAVMLDISRDKVPTLDTLRDLIDRLASWKINQVQLYMEHTFAYRDHEVVWADADPLTAEDITGLDQFCRERHVELVPNQNCLGHMERWLRHERYRPLAISPDGFKDMRGRVRPPTTVEPTNPAALVLFRELLTELLECFTSRRVHVGLDEPWELPPQRINDYLTHLQALRALPTLDGREMLVWGDILAQHPDVIASVPDGVTVCEWGYEFNHPFDARCSRLKGAGQPFWVAPGTSSWITLGGRVSNATGNIWAAVDAAAAHGGTGLLNTDWGDRGHLQYLPVSDPGFAYGAAVSWCAATNRDLDLAAALSAHSFHDRTDELGRALVALGDAHRGVQPQMINESILALAVYHPTAVVGQGASKGLTVEDLANVASTITAAMDAVARSTSDRPDAALVREELTQTGELLLHCGRDAGARLQAGGRIEDVPAATRRTLAGELDPLIDRHRQLWLARNRPGGLEDSVAMLTRLRATYVE